MSPGWFVWLVLVGLEVGYRLDAYCGPHGYLEMESLLYAFRFRCDIREHAYSAVVSYGCLCCNRVSEVRWRAQ